MAAQRTEIIIETKRQGLHLITREVAEALARFQNDGPALLNLFIKHTSASLLIQENASPSARADLEEFINRLAPENQSWHRHLDEGPDDTASHLKSAVTPTSLTVPVNGTRLDLGTWQGIYLWEHRRHPHRRKIVLTLLN